MSYWWASEEKALFNCLACKKEGKVFKMPQDNFEMIPLLPSHTNDLVTMADGTGFFKEHEVRFSKKRLRQ